METIDEHPTGRCSTKATPTVTESQKLLSTLGQGYKRAKAQQILRLLKDQESLNQRFKDCALDEGDEDEENSNNNAITKQTGGLNDADIEGNNQSNQSSTDNKRPFGWKKTSNVDPSRCRTSMGFYNHAECSNSVDEDIDVQAAENADLELDVGAEADMSFDEFDHTMPRIALGASNGGNMRRLFRLQLNEDSEVIPEESFTQSARSSRPKTGITTGSAKSKQYRRPSQNDSMGRSTGNNIVSTSISKLDGPFTPRGGVKGFCDGQKTPRDDAAAACLTPRQNDLKLCLTPRHEPGYQSRHTLNEFAGYFTPRSYEVSNAYTPRQNDTGTCYTPRQNDGYTSHTPRLNDDNTSYTPRHNNDTGFYTPRPFDLNGGGKYTPRHNDTGGCLTPRQTELYFNSRLDDMNHSMTPRPSHPVQRGVRGLHDNPISPREDSTPLSTPRRDDISGGITPRSYNIISAPFNSHHTPAVSNSMRNGRQVEQSLFEMSPAFSNEPSRTKRQQGNISSKIMSTTDNGHGRGKGKRNVNVQLTPRAVLSVDNSPIQLVPAGTLDGEVTPRRQKVESKGKKRGDIQRIGGHQNLNKLSERVRPIAVMKLPPLDVAINKPVAS